MVRKLGIVIGMLWVAYAADLLIRETASVTSGPLLFSSYLKVLLQVALLALVGAWLVFGLKGRALISLSVTSFVALGYFVFLSNTWYEPGFETWYAIAVVVAYILTVLHAALVWTARFRDSSAPKRAGA